MTHRHLTAALAAALMLVSQAVVAQEPADFASARKMFVAGNARGAANALLMSSMEVRTQIGRCKDVDVGTQLIDGEAKLEQLAAQLRAGKIDNVKTLDAALTHIDLALAQHHVMIAMNQLAKNKPDDVMATGRDLEKAAFHLERSVTLDGHALSAEQRAAIDDARKASASIFASKVVPANGAATATTLARTINPALAPAK